MTAAVDFTLYLISDRTQVPAGRTLVEQVRGALAGGVQAVQLREKDLPAATLYPLALELRNLTREYGARLLVNDRIDLALAVEADGVHLGTHSLPLAVARRLLGPARLLGVSCHSLAEAEAARAGGADFLTFGPVFATPSKAAYGPPVGPALLAEACAALPLPVFALGGINTATARSLHQSGCHGIALIGAIIAADDPAIAASDLLRAFTGQA